MLINFGSIAITVGLPALIVGSLPAEDSAGGCLPHPESSALEIPKTASHSN